jgi:hypothetical protein
MEMHPSLRQNPLLYFTADSVWGWRGTERQLAAEDLVLEHSVSLIVAYNNDGQDSDDSRQGDFKELCVQCYGSSSRGTDPELGIQIALDLGSTY